MEWYPGHPPPAHQHLTIPNSLHSILHVAHIAAEHNAVGLKCSARNYARHHSLDKKNQIPHPSFQIDRFLITHSVDVILTKVIISWAQRRTGSSRLHDDGTSRTTSSPRSGALTTSPISSHRIDRPDRCQDYTCAWLFTFSDTPRPSSVRSLSLHFTLVHSTTFWRVCAVL